MHLKLTGTHERLHHNGKMPGYSNTQCTELIIASNCHLIATGQLHPYIFDIPRYSRGAYVLIHQMGNVGRPNLRNNIRTRRWQWCNQHSSFGCDQQCIEQYCGDSNSYAQQKSNDGKDDTASSTTKPTTNSSETGTPLLGSWLLGLRYGRTSIQRSHELLLKYCCVYLTPFILPTQVVIAHRIFSQEPYSTSSALCNLHNADDITFGQTICSIAPTIQVS